MSESDGGSKKDSQLAPLRRAPTRTSSQDSNEDAEVQPSSSRGGSGRNYMFIDQSFDRRRVSEAVRVHVMRDSHRTRRQLRGMQRADVPQGQISFMQTTPASDESATPPPRRGVSQSRRSSRSPISRRSSVPHSQVSEEETSNPTLSRLTSRAEERQVSEEETSNPTLSQLTSRAEEQLTRTQSLITTSIVDSQMLDLCRNDSAALNAFLALTIWERSSAEGATDDIESLEYEARALESLRQRLSDSGIGRDSLWSSMLTIALLSRFERLRGHEETAAFHQTALQRLVDGQGGMEGLAAEDEGLATALRRLGTGA